MLALMWNRCGGSGGIALRAAGPAWQIGKKEGTASIGQSGVVSEDSS